MKRSQSAWRREFTCRGQAVALSAGQYSGLWLLGTAINGGHRSQDARTFYAYSYGFT